MTKRLKERPYTWDKVGALIRSADGLGMDLTDIFAELGRGYSRRDLAKLNRTAGRRRSEMTRIEYAELMQQLGTAIHAAIIEFAQSRED